MAAQSIEAARLRALLTAARDAIISIDTRGLITLFNPGASEMFGYEPAQVLGKNISMLMTDTEARRHDGYVETYLDTGRKGVIDRVRRLHARRSNGNVFPIQLAVSEAHVGDEQFFIAIIRDETRLHQVETELREQRDFARRLIETAPAVVLVLDTDGLVMQYNNRLEEITDLPLSRCVGKSFCDTFLAREHHSAFESLFERAVAERRAVNSTVVPLRDVNGVPVHIEWTISVLTSVDGEVIGVLCMGHDITRSLVAESAVQSYRRLVMDRERRADFAALISQLIHDLGNPLAGLSMQAQLIRDTARRTPETPAREILEQADNILTEVRRLETQVRSLLVFSREEQRLQLKSLDAQKLVERLLALWQPVARNQQIQVIGSVDETISFFSADEEKLRRVIENLIKNAIEAMSKTRGDRIQLDLDVTQPHGIRITVTDNGPGLPEGIKVFRLFESTKEGGSGLGLALSRQFIQAHGGELRHEPGPDGGARFIIELPNARRSQD